MRKKTELIPFLLLAGLVGAFGFGVASAETITAKVDLKQFARGAKAWAKTCARFHNLKSAQDHSD